MKITEEWITIFSKVARVRVPLLFVTQIDFKDDGTYRAECPPSFIIPHYDNDHILEKQLLDLKTIDQKSIVVYDFKKMIAEITIACERYLQRKKK